MEQFLPLVAVLLMIGVIFFVLHVGRPNSILKSWATSHGFRILNRKRCYFKGPFSWMGSHGQPVYYVTVEDEEGQKRRGWVRCGGFFLGILSDEAEVHWEHTPHNPFS